MIFFTAKEAKVLFFLSQSKVCKKCVNLYFYLTFYFSKNLQPDLSGALFYWWLSLSKPAIKKAGAEGGIVCPNHYFIHRNHLLRRLFLQFFYVGPGNVLRTKCKLGAINRA